MPLAAREAEIGFSGSAVWDLRTVNCPTPKLMLIW